MSISSVETYKNTHLKTNGVWQKNAFKHILCAMECRDPSCLDSEKIEEYSYLLTIAYEYIKETRDETAIKALKARIEYDCTYFYLISSELPRDHLYAYSSQYEKIFTDATLKLRLLQEQITSKCSWCDGNGWTYEDVVRGIKSICTRCVNGNIVCTHQ